MGSGREGAFEKVRKAARVRLLSHVRPPTSEGHNFFVRIPIQVFLDSMESSLSQYSILMHMEGIGYWIWLEWGVQVGQVGYPGKAA